MLDAGPLPLMQRSRGRAGAGFAPGPDGRARLTRLSQHGSAKVILPRTGRPDPEVVFLNTAGGLASGDELAWSLTLDPGCRATATTQTAERAYRAEGPPADVHVDLTLGAGARLDWLPQETILFDGAALARQTRIALGPRAQVLFAETLILGRAAMGERVRRLDLRDERRVTRDGAPVLTEALRLTDAALAGGARPALLGGARALSTLALIAPGAEDALGPMRALLTEDGVQGAASGWDGRLIVRLLAADGWPLRRQLIRLLTRLRAGPLPRVWQI